MHWRQFFKKNYALICILIFCSISLRIPAWLYPPSSDYLLFLFIGREILAGKTLYLEVWDHKPPLIFYINGLISWLSGNSVWLPQIWLLLWLVGEYLVLYFFLKRLFTQLGKPDPETNARLGLIFYSLFRNQAIFINAINTTENFGLIFLLGMYWLALEWLWQKSRKFLALSGVCLSVLIFLKPNFVILSLPLLIEISQPVFTELRLRRWTNVWSTLKRVSINYVILFLPILGQTLFWVWFFASRSALTDFWNASFWFSFKYLSVINPEYLGQFLYALIIVLNLMVITILSLVWLWFSISHGLKTILLSQNLRFLFWLGLASWLFIAIFWYGLPYYFLITFLPMSILLTAIKLSTKPIFISLLIGSLLLVISITLLILPFNFLKNYSKTTDAQENTVLPEVVAYLKPELSSEKQIYVLDRGAAIYYYTHTSSVSRYFSAHLLDMDHQANLGFQINQTVINDLQRQKPKYIVINTNFWQRQLPLNTYIQTCYVSVKTIHYYQLWQIQDSCL